MSKVWCIVKGSVWTIVKGWKVENKFLVKSLTMIQSFIVNE